VSEGLFLTGAAALQGFRVPTPGGTQRRTQGRTLAPRAYLTAGFEMTVAVASGQSCSNRIQRFIGGGKLDHPGGHRTPRPTRSLSQSWTIPLAGRKARYYRIILTPRFVDQILEHPRARCRNYGVLEGAPLPALARLRDSRFRFS